ncbi:MULTISPECIES: hypothetical protein [Bacillus cereus group]|uniref:hypothetical protein n=1 Tax=Bacillus cereus group TaxID=86661 RepID=UPI0011CCAF65|nr:MULTISPECIES: hypothetical protein [Bacillus cereus group]QWG81190.1 hypothetical protein EXW27_27845 [Bacillus mycoides]TXR71426.1 hypothetical protein DN408_29275 [Bacillus sp. AR13-1]
MKNCYKLTYKLTSFNGTTLTGVTIEGITLTANVTTQTIYHPAHLDQYSPTDPIRPLVVAYNAAVRSGRRPAILNAVTALANAGASAQVRLDSCNNTVVCFRPVPQM